MASREKALKKLGLVHCPTVRELAAEGLAEAIEEKVGKTTRTVYKVTKKGQKRIDKAIAHNAPILRQLEADRLTAHAKELEWRARHDDLMHLLSLASKGI